MRLRITYIVREAQHDLWRAVPSSSDIFGHEALVSGGLGGWCSSASGSVSTSQTKVANLQLAIGVDQQVAGLQVSVQDIGRVDVLRWNRISAKR